MFTRRLLLGLSTRATRASIPNKSIYKPTDLRSYAQQTSTSSNAVDNMDMHTFHKLSDKVFDSLTEALESELEEGAFDVAETSEVDYSSGVLTLSLDKYGTYVINKQPPTRQIWVSSPFSGPRRYEYDIKLNTWLDVRDGSSLNQMLDEELSPIFNKQLEVGLGWME
ncbi:Frataxin [Wallemia mellicola CBS 633.66]|uniref:ferroxidase n=2 Tax=Wallemia mellicola TaxID=1708541 RepID=A0A4T0NPH3_9BASI|nr:Frataxin [Wallemia mellicola CBS 633.66]TIB67378.1 hypothetical protein E3Q24_04182 [Wallemia mellicola]EIM19364.1 Frataxin [Wallemia mellicola CBS 633.66]TIB70231.1 hypothetical protein E3Q23_04233 [Wallemia mellicola]TIB79123.1 Frataxin [Wallemia mellicola]TIB83292.1 Frataxin [Wallemia mellicola]|eukprot:XP_006960640.1 Frataxin [Wallemia mellicola CBS 633.66]